jgi:hypothetical protein
VRKTEKVTRVLIISMMKLMKYQAAILLNREIKYNHHISTLSAINAVKLKRREKRVASRLTKV